MKEFLEKKIKPKKGKIRTTSGEIVGTHDGLPFYTVGQRQGVAKMGGKQPLYVVAKNFKKNELVVGFENDPLLYKKEILLEDTHFVSGQAPVFPLQCEVRLRHRQPLQKATLQKGKKKGETVLTFSKLQKAVTPGQFAVFYQKGECLGGGVIKE